MVGRLGSAGNGAAIGKIEACIIVRGHEHNRVISRRNGRRIGVGEIQRGFKICQRHRAIAGRANRTARIIVEVHLVIANAGKADGRSAGGSANGTVIVEIHLLVYVEQCHGLAVRINAPAGLIVEDDHLAAGQ